MCARFVSADDRQLAVAKATGLAVVDIKRSWSASEVVIASLPRGARTSSVRRYRE